MSDDFVMPILLPLDVVSLTMTLVNIDSVTGEEAGLAGEVERVLTPLPHLEVSRHGDTVVARTDLGLGERVLLVGHLDTVPPSEPVDDGLAAVVEMGRLQGLGACDMKGGLAVMLKLAALGHYGRDVTFAFYDGGEADGASGLERLASVQPELLAADLAVVLEPSDAEVEPTDPADPVSAEFVAAFGGAPRAASSRAATATLTGLGVPSVVYGPGDPALAHGADEHVTTAQLAQCEHLLTEWLRA